MIDPTYAHQSYDVKWMLIKRHRNLLITRYEWTQAQHATITQAQKDTALIYIQTLKDIPQQYANPDDVIFPDAPQFLLDWDNGL